MKLKKYINRTLVLGLTVSSVYVSTQYVYALNEDMNNEASKSTNKIELKVDEKQEVVTKKTATVKTSVLNVREEASEESEKVGALVEGMVVEVLETKEDWTKVKYNDKEGWVSSEFVANEKATVNTHELNLRKAPSTEEESLEKLKRDTNLEILNILEVKDVEEDATKVWYEVKVLEESDKEKEDKTGFVFAEYAITESEAARLEEERIKAEAKAEAERKAQEKANASKTVQSNPVVSNATNKPSETKPSETKPSTTKPNTGNSSANLSGRTITVNASAYSGHTITATGTVPKWGTIAVDPSVIPYGTKVYIPMFDKVFIAEDCGGAIKGNKIDIFMNSASETTNFGRRNIEIKILG